MRVNTSGSLSGTGSIIAGVASTVIGAKEYQKEKEERKKFQKEKFEWQKEHAEELKQQRDRETTLAEKVEERKRTEMESNIAKKTAEAELKTAQAGRINEQTALSKFQRSKKGREFELEKIRAQSQAASASAADSQATLQENHQNDIASRSALYSAIQAKDPNKALFPNGEQYAVVNGKTIFNPDYEEDEDDYVPEAGEKPENMSPEEYSKWAQENPMKADEFTKSRT